MEIICPVHLKDESIFINKVLNNSVSSLSWKHVIFYKYLRPFIPADARHFLNRVYNSNKSYKENFIDDTLVNLIKNNSDYMEEIKKLYPSGCDYSIIMTHDVEAQEGFNFIPKVIELEDKYKIKSSWNIVPFKYKIDLGIIKLIRDAGHEIGIHGYSHDGKLFLSEEIFDKRAPYINEALEKYRSKGFRAPMVHHNIEWLQKLNILYDSSFFDYDPFQACPDSIGFIWPFRAGKFIELPYTLPQDHTLYLVLNQKTTNIWKAKTRWLAENHGIILSLTHPDYLKKKNILKHYEEFLDYLKIYNKAWNCLPSEIAEFWMCKEGNRTNLFRN